MSNSLRPAIANWVWLAELSSAEDALLVGDCPLFVRAGLERHFSTIAQAPHANEGASGDGLSSISLPFDGGTFDCVVVEDEFGGASLDPSLPGAVTFLQRLRHVLRDGGCVCVPLKQLQRRSPARLARHIRKAGYTKIRMFYVYESLARPNTFVPVNRRATAYFELFAWGGLKGRVRSLLAFAGLHHLLHPTLIVLAYR